VGSSASRVVSAVAELLVNQC